MLSHWTPGSSSPMPNPFKLGSFSLDKHFYMEQFDVEKWYPLISDDTFETKFVPLTLEEAVAFKNQYQRNIGRKVEGEDEDKALLKDLGKRLEETMNSFGGDQSTKSFFVRLSSRSPKDATLSDEHPGFLKTLHRELLLNLDLDPHNATGSLEQILILVDNCTDTLLTVDALLNTSLILMEAKTADDIIWLIEHSERTFSDLMHTINHLKENNENSDLKYDWNMKLVIRRWNKKVKLENEFRCFVVKGKLTAITQYNNMCIYKKWVNKEKEIATLLLNQWKKIAPKLTDYPVAVVDFVILDQNDILVIEMNPFGPMTGGSLFNYSSKEDRYIVQGGIDVWGDLEKPKKDVEIVGEDELPIVRLVKNIPDSGIGLSTVFDELREKYFKEKEKEQMKKSKENEPESSCIIS